jgi:hypothetical protein
VSAGRGSCPNVRLSLTALLAAVMQSRSVAKEAGTNPRTLFPVARSGDTGLSDAPTQLLYDGLAEEEFPRRPDTRRSPR